MYVILVYDVNVARVGKVLKRARRYLTWVQNSVLEGELTEASYRALKSDLARVIDTREDSVLFYVLGARKYTRRELMGVQKGGEEWIY
ncbi:CRISPR-associated endonuclease Cas2 [Candidatus Desulforudis audaxviator]|uniref:CRISPR-associated endoribonuclease Cas2 n=1 Tax=Desulforudis audaxviator (strain MP104C) TaxID=477974 RepID=B1I5M9_DESAP|nr:CRISPR-associated endonuclease Cas2 [Candidatus Desulforudis audaxviator]ACA60306.1 CRISPR-associated protein Cas2 [Candidatus Desulforudis audaxviator MP104C]AZK60354.1 CRISPR-associated protein Cas2 [Candidatus Desulforudis audaxviator]